MLHSASVQRQTPSPHTHIDTHTFPIPDIPYDFYSFNVFRTSAWKNLWIHVCEYLPSLHYVVSSSPYNILPPLSSSIFSIGEEAFTYMWLDHLLSFLSFSLVSSSPGSQLCRQLIIGHAVERRAGCDSTLLVRLCVCVHCVYVCLSVLSGDTHAAALVVVFRHMCAYVAHVRASDCICFSESLRFEMSMV